ncbi:MAG: hypothetical protein JWO36_74 [Myxococcales bacterium]|nr:hypothetical protein [Myxococcales bacterium]
MSGRMKSAATMSDVNHLLGDVDPLIADRIIAMGATTDEIAEALRGVEDERGFGEESHTPSSPRVIELRALLYELAAADEETSEEYEARY